MSEGISFEVWNKTLPVVSRCFLSIDSTKSCYANAGLNSGVTTTSRSSAASTFCWSIHGANDHGIP